MRCLLFCSTLLLLMMLVIASVNATPRGRQGAPRTARRPSRPKSPGDRPGRRERKPEREDSNITVLTFNTGMFSPTPTNAFTHDARFAALLGSIATSEVWRSTDIACLQEIRRFPDFTAVSEALHAAGFAHQHSFVESFQSSPSRTACENSTALDEFITCSTNHPLCALLNAGGAPLPLVGTCVFYNCPQFEELSQHCVECLLDHRQPLAILRDYRANSQRCASVPETSYRPTHGLLLASRRPLIRPQAVPFLPGETTFLVYGYLKAKVSSTVDSEKPKRLANQT